MCWPVIVRQIEVDRELQLLDEMKPGWCDCLYKHLEVDHDMEVEGVPGVEEMHDDGISI